MKTLYIIAGCNGAGKTTVSYTILPEILGVREFVNADEIAHGLSPFSPESASIQAGRLMLERIDFLLSRNISFAIETTLATRSYIQLIQKAQSKGYVVSLIFFWLSSVELAIRRVHIRVQEGGHNIPEETIIRRYENELKNFFQRFIHHTDEWLFIDNSEEIYQIVAEGDKEKVNLHQEGLWKSLKAKYDRT